MENTYFPASHNSSCSSMQGLYIDSLKECHYAATRINEFGSKVAFTDEENSTIWPTGCYMYGLSSKKITWNNNTNGLLNSWSRSMCKRNGKNVICKYFIGIVVYY